MLYNKSSYTTMAFGICSLKALAFSRQLEIEDETIMELKQFLGFLVKIYVPHFLASSLGSSAPMNNLLLYKKLFSYRSINP